MILVIGASGHTGRAVVRALARHGAAVRALIREPVHEPSVRAEGATEVVVGDLRDLSDIEHAVDGCNGVFLIGPRFMPEEAQVGTAVVDTAARLGARRLVYSGVYHPSIAALFNHRAKLAVEDRLFATDLEFTVLQPARFMHGPLLSSWTRVRDDGVYADAFDLDRPMAYVDYDDVAEAVALAFTTDTLVRGCFELSSPGEHTAHDIAAQLATALGRPIRAERAALDGYGPAQGPAMANPFAREGFARLRDYYDAFGFRGGNSLVLETILGRPPTELPRFVSAFVDARSG